MAGKKEGKKGNHMIPGKKHMIPGKKHMMKGEKHMMKDSEMGHPEMMPKKMGKKGK